MRQAEDKRCLQEINWPLNPLYGETLARSNLVLVILVSTALLYNFVKLIKLLKEISQVGVFAYGDHAFIAVT